MDYKKVIKSRALRSKILNMLSFIPDKQMLQLQYYIKMGRKLNLENPQRYTEKIQWYKLYYKNPVMVACVDKYDVRSFVKEKGLEHLLTNCYGVFDNVDKIDFNALPSQFVVKDTLAGGGNSVVVVKDKNSLDVKKLKQQMQQWLSRPCNVKGGGREWPYYTGKKHRIIIEEYLSEESNFGLTDYKFFCFSGNIACVYVINNRTLGEHGQLAVMDEAFERMPVKSTTQAEMLENPEKPKNYEEMVKIVKILSQQFPHVRVDMYNIDGRIVFGELTFFGASGYQTFNPDSFDFELGEKFVLKKY